MHETRITEGQNSPRTIRLSSGVFRLMGFGGRPGLGATMSEGGCVAVGEGSEVSIDTPDDEIRRQSGIAGFDAEHPRGGGRGRSGCGSYTSQLPLRLIHDEWLGGGDTLAVNYATEHVGGQWQGHVEKSDDDEAEHKIC